MSGAWMLYVLLVGTLLACAATAVDGVVRRTIVPTRWVWAAALAGLMILVSIVPHRGSHAAGPIAQVVAARTPPMGGMAPTGSAIAAAVRSAREYIALSIAATIGVVDSGTRHRFMIPLVATWGLLSVAIVAMLVVVNRQVARARRSWPVVQLHGFAVRITPDVGPAVIGVARPEIVVPRWLLRRSDEEQRLVVVHEREHVAACDQVVLTGAWIAAALLPWHPAVWWMLSRLRLAIELDCDARVLRRGVPARSYGALLIDIAGQCASLRVGALALADRTTHLERRLLAMKPSRSRFAFLRVATLGTSAALLLAAACEARLPTSTEVASMDVAAAEKAATSLLLPKDLARAVYIVNGVVVTEAEAHAIAGSSIGPMM